MANLYTYSSTLSALISKTGCSLPFSNARVTLYRVIREECPTEPQISKTFQQLTEEDMKARSNNILAEGRADENGNIRLVIDGDKTDYNGGCLEVVVSFDRIPGSGRQLDGEEHFLIARYQPGWQQTDAGFSHYMALVVPSNIWCTYLLKYDIWVICGRVVTCEKLPSPVGGVKVKAFDVDWIQHDFLGEATTAPNGWFYIYYTSSEFKKTSLSPFINLEWKGGPDVYFQIEGVDSDGNPITLLDEPPATGRQPGRENVPNCFCIELCVKLGPKDPKEVPMWTEIGDYQIPDSVNLHDFRADGYTQVGELAFYGTMTLIGQTGTATPSRRLRYRFLYEENWTGPAMPANIVTKDMIAPTRVGELVVATTPSLIVEPVYVNHPSALHNIVPDANGWIEVETAVNYTPVGKRLIRLISTYLAPYDTYSNPAPNPNAGNAAPIDVARQVHVFGIGYQIEENTGSGWTPLYEQVMEKLVINNARTLLWLELDEFLTGANLCQPITNIVTARYTADHPHLEWFEVEIEKQGSHVHWAVPRVDHAGSVTFRGDHSTGTPPTANNPVNVTSWDACSYIVFLRAHRRLTNGYGGPSAEYVYRTFCKS